MRILLVGGCGYIGSFLFRKLVEDGLEVAVCDSLRRLNPAAVPVHFGQYQELTAETLAGFEAVLWFAGHSSVYESVQDPAGALSNNCIDLHQFAAKLKPGTKFIYASTASLYSSKDEVVRPSTEKSLIKIPEQNAYDASKFAFDYIAKNYLDNYFGLRMGTLAGYSRNLRAELVFNAMNLSASQQGVIKLQNSDTRRTILFLDDLWSLVDQLLRNDHKPGFYNAGSYSGSMADLAMAISQVWKAPIQYEGDSPTYSFSLDCTKMRAICGPNHKPPSLEDYSVKFISDYRNQHYGIR